MKTNQTPDHANTEESGQAKLRKMRGKAVPFIEMTVTHASVLTILAISFERYYAICQPLKAGYICTKARACVICLCAWTLAALSTSPMLVIAEYSTAPYNDGTEVPICQTAANTPWRQAFYYISNSVFFWVPLLILLALYSVIAVHLMADPGIKGSETFSHRARSQLVIMLATVVLSFFLCLMPFRVFVLWFISAHDKSIRSLGVDLYFNLLYFCRLMNYLHSAINPILYNLMSSKFREGFVNICGPRAARLLFGRRRRLRYNHSLNTTMTSMSYSGSRRDRDYVGSGYYFRGSSQASLGGRSLRNAALLTRENSRATLPSPILHRVNTCVSDTHNSFTVRTLSEYDNVSKVAHSLEELACGTEKDMLIRHCSEDTVCQTPPDRGKVGDSQTTDSERPLLKYSESMRRGILKNRMYQRHSEEEGDTTGEANGLDRSHCAEYPPVQAESNV